VNIEQQHPYIAIEGVIGVGKTTLARLLQARFQGETRLEAFDENPFLSDFYGDRERYAFQTQLFFLLSRYRQQQSIPTARHSHALLLDYCFEKDKLFAHLNIHSADELAMYDRLYAALAEKVPVPDLVVYLRAETDTLMARIAMRDRPYERQMDRDYITALRQGYEILFANYTHTPLLIIDTDTLDFVQHAADLNDIEQRIRAALAGVRQPPLPDMRLAGPRPAGDLASVAAPMLDVPAAQVAEQPPANWQALSDFLALTVAVGNIGGLLAQPPPVSPEGPPQALQTALQRAAQALATLAERTGVPLNPSLY